MTSDVPHPYTVSIEPSKKAEGQYGWLLRRSGKLIERSDRFFTSEVKAHENALRAIEIDVKGSFVSRR